MANTKSTEKRIRQNKKRRERNSKIKSSVRTGAKKVIKAIANPSDSQNINEFFKQFTKKIDTAARKGIVHKNTAARKKSRLAQKINLSVKNPG